jgi:hypothetical protein
VQILGDGSRLQQVALNLVSNAVKFTTYGEVALIVTEDGSQATISIQDTGLGVPLAEQVAIFDEFRQSERSVARGYGGLGIGLAICRQLVELHKLIQGGKMATVRNLRLHAGHGLNYLNVLPVAAIVFNNLALLSLIMRGSMLDVLAQDYVRTSQAMGLKAKTVYWKHAFRNALFPVITMFGRMLPGVFGGAITIEYLFQIPGMGIKTQQAFYNQDFPMLMALIFIMACITIVGSLLADWLYARVDPRVKLS